MLAAFAAAGVVRARILLRVRRFFCDNPQCRSKTFAEQVAGLTRRWSRVSEGLRRIVGD